MIIRDVRESDLNLIRDSFVRSVKDVCSDITNGLSTNALRLLLDKAILGGWSCNVLCEQDTQDEVMAWIVHRRSDLIWLLRKPRFKGMKLGQTLLNGCIPRGTINCAFMNTRLTQRLLSLGYNCKLRPYITTEIMSYD